MHNPWGLFLAVRLDWGLFSSWVPATKEEQASGLMSTGSRTQAVEQACTTLEPAFPTTPQPRRRSGQKLSLQDVLVCSPSSWNFALLPLKPFGLEFASNGLWNLCYISRLPEKLFLCVSENQSNLLTYQIEIQSQTTWPSWRLPRDSQIKVVVIVCVCLHLIKGRQYVLTVRFN